MEIKYKSIDWLNFRLTFRTQHIDRRTMQTMHLHHSTWNWNLSQNYAFLLMLLCNKINVERLTKVTTTETKIESEYPNIEIKKKEQNQNKKYFHSNANDRKLTLITTTINTAWCWAAMRCGSEHISPNTSDFMQMNVSRRAFCGQRQHTRNMCKSQQCIIMLQNGFTGENAFHESLIWRQISIFTNYIIGMVFNRSKEFLISAWYWLSKSNMNENKM